LNVKGVTILVTFFFIFAANNYKMKKVTKTTKKVKTGSMDTGVPMDFEMMTPKIKKMKTKSMPRKKK
jgi:hypothetical protein